MACANIKAGVMYPSAATAEIFSTGCKAQEAHIMNGFTVEELQQMRMFIQTSYANASQSDIGFDEDEMKGILGTANQLVEIKLQDIGIG